MLVPYKPVYFKKAYKKFRYIVIHDLTCRFSKLDKAKIDTKKSSTSYLRGYNWVFNDEFDLPYHVLCEKIGMDYETIMCTPFAYFCKYDDIPAVYEPSIHIGIAGNFSVIQPKQRLYQQIGYRSIASFIKWFKIPISNILLHREITNNKKLQCPGLNFDKNKLMANIKPLILQKG